MSTTFAALLYVTPNERRIVVPHKAREVLGVVVRDTMAVELWTADGRRLTCLTKIGCGWRCTLSPEIRDEVERTESCGVFLLRRA